jgi:hypothetical protein
MLAAALDNPDVPLRLAIPTLADAAAEVRHFIQSTAPPEREYLYSLKGEYRLTGKPEPRPGLPDVSIRARGDMAPGLLDGRATYADRLADVIGRAEWVGIRSRFLYAHETWIRDGQIARVVGRLLARGARIELAEAAVHPEPGASKSSGSESDASETGASETGASASGASGTGASGTGARASGGSASGGSAPGGSASSGNASSASASGGSASGGSASSASGTGASGTGASGAGGIAP